MMDSRTSKDTFVLPVVLVALSNAVVAGANLIRIPLLTKMLGPELFGIWSIISVSVSLVIPFTSIVLRTSLIRFLAAERDKEVISVDLSSAYALVMLLAAGTAVLVSGTLKLASWAVPSLTLPMVLLGLAGGFLIVQSLQEIPLGYLRAKQRMASFAGLLALQSITQLGAVALFLLGGLRVEGVLLGLLSAGAILVLGSGLLILRELGWRRPNPSAMRKYVRWGLPLAPNAAITWVIHASDRYILGALLGTASVGIYTAAYQISGFATFLLHAIVSVTYPKFIKSYELGDSQQAVQHIERALRYLLMFSIPAAAGLSVLSGPLVRSLTTQDFADGIRIVPLVAFGAVFFGVYQIVVSVVHAVNRTHLTLRMLTTAALLNLVLNLVLIPHFRLLGAAVSTFISYACLALIAVLVTRRYLSYRLHPGFCLKVVLATAVMTIIVGFLARPQLVTIPGSIAMGAVSYGFSLFMLGGVSTEEKDAVMRAVRALLQGKR